jgi:hypothetical protein
MEDPNKNVVVRLSREEAKVMLIALNSYTHKLRGDDPPKLPPEMDTPEARRRMAEDNARHLEQTQEMCTTVARARDLADPGTKRLGAEQPHR